MSIFGALEECRNTSLPDQIAARAAKRNARRHKIDSTNPLYDEALVDLRRYGLAGENYYHSPHNPPYWRRIEGSIPGLYGRGTVAAKLLAVNARLAAAGLELFLFDAWRPRAVQAYFHDIWMPASLAARDPALTGAALIREVENYWSAPTADVASPAPHETGAAVDLTVRWIGGEKLWMGSLFDDVTPLAHRDRFERDDDGWSFSDAEARANRRLLYWVMAAEGFAGHPNEWWHFSYGDQLWAVLGGAPAAFYGLSAPQEVAA